MLGFYSEALLALGFYGEALLALGFWILGREIAWREKEKVVIVAPMECIIYNKYYKHYYSVIISILIIMYCFKA